MPTLYQLRNRRSNVRRCNIAKCGRYFKYSSPNMHYCGHHRTLVNLLRRKTQESKAWNLLLYLAGGICPSCACPTQVFTIDHITPMTTLWDWRWQNLQPLCPMCNVRKAKKRIDYRPSWWVGTLQEMENAGLL